VTDDPKRNLIRKSATSVMMRYGFQRTTMDDIAKEAGMSRPALYVFYKNKEDIYRDVLATMAADCIAAAEKAAADGSDLKTRLGAIIKVGFLDIYEKVVASPHGAELLDLKSGLANDIVAQWHSANERILAGAIGGKKAVTHAKLILDSINGIKMRTSDISEIRKGVEAVVALVAEA
jgi:AcrR family transcriptional regulator